MPLKYRNQNVFDLVRIPGWEIAVAAGECPNAFFVNKFGENPTLGTTKATIWDAGGLYQYIQTADYLQISSNDPVDTLAGTGARTVYLEGLDENWNMVNEIVEMDGTTNVQTTNKFIRIFRMAVTTAGSGEEAAGTITAKIGAITHAQIINGNNQSLMGLYTVPAGYTAYLVYGKMSTGKGKDIIGSFVARPFGGVFNLAHRLYVYQGNYDFDYYKSLSRIPEKTDIEIRGIADQTVAVGGAFNLLVIKN